MVEIWECTCEGQYPYSVFVSNGHIIGWYYGKSTFYHYDRYKRLTFLFPEPTFNLKLIGTFDE